MGSYNLRTVGEEHSPSHRVFLEDGNSGDILSFFHDVPLHVGREDIFNFVLEIPRWTNAKLEIATCEEGNPIKQDVKKGALRYVANLFPINGYPWNYGAFPQTWEDPSELCRNTGHRGDNDPLDVIEIGAQKGFTGQIKPVKVLGALALVDEGETDWKIVAIDVEDPLAHELSDIEDVKKKCPGLLEATLEWFKLYKIPDGKPENSFAFNGEFKNKQFALQVIQEAHGAWKKLKCGEKASNGISTCFGPLKLSNGSLHSYPELLRSLMPRNVTKNTFSIIKFNLCYFTNKTLLDVYLHCWTAAFVIILK